MPELGLSRGVEQSAYHHLDTLGHILDVVRYAQQELEEDELGARVRHADGLLLAALLHDVAKPVTRGELNGRVAFVAHDTVGARLAGMVAGRLGLGAQTTDIVVTLTELHLKVGFMAYDFTDYPAPRLALAAGPFGEELAVLCLADRLAAQGPKLKPEQLELHRKLCRDFLRVSRESGPYPTPDYAALEAPTEAGTEGGAGCETGPVAAGILASRRRLLEARGTDRVTAGDYTERTRSARTARPAGR